MSGVVQEIERKYEAPAEAVDALGRIPGLTLSQKKHEHLLDALYFDTADLRLLRAGITLRRRAGGDDAGWHLKLPAGPDTRDEVRAPAGAGADERVPDELAAFAAVHTRGRPLTPVAELRTARAVRQLGDKAGARLAEIATDAVTARRLVGKPTTMAWTETEVEVVRGGRKLLAVIDRALAARGARQPKAASKLARVLAEPAARTQRPRRRRKGKRRAGDIAVDHLRAQAALLTAWDPRVRLDRPDAIHQMRVAARRARSTLQTYGPLLDRAVTRPLAAELRWLGGALGAARDREVLRARLEAHLDATPPELETGPARDRIATQLTAEYDQARQAALADMASDRYLRLLDSLDALIADPPLTKRGRRSAAKALRPLTRKARGRLDRALDQADAASAQDRDAALHEARKAAKRARYVAEAARPVLGGKNRRQASRAKRLQEVLGEHHDSVVARQALLELAAGARQAGEDTFVYGLMHEREAWLARLIEREVAGG